MCKDVMMVSNTIPAPIDNILGYFVEFNMAESYLAPYSTKKKYAVFTPKALGYILSVGVQYRINKCELMFIDTCAIEDMCVNYDVEDNVNVFCLLQELQNEEL